MSNSPSLTNRLNMRRLRAGELASSGSTTKRGTLPTTELLVRALDVAIDESRQDSSGVMAFTLQLRLLPLAQWGQVETPPQAVLAKAVAERLAQVDVELVSVSGAVEKVNGYAPGVARQDDHDRIAALVMAAVGEPFDIDGRPLHFEARIGTASLDENNTTATQLLDASQLALASTDESTPHLAYDARLREGKDRENRLRADLAEAVAGDELEVIYQPILDIGARELIGLEAYVRWEHPTLGPVEPSEFLRIAETHGLIYGIGDYVLPRSIDLVGHWAAGGLLGPTTLWVNFTPAELLRRGFISRVRAVLDPSTQVTLGIDVSEGPALREKSVCDVVRTLAADGVRAAVDNFGGDFSLLSELGRLPFDTLKLSRELVCSLEHDSYGRRAVELITEAAKQRGLFVIAAGVETPGQFEILEAIGTRAIQGHLASEPLSAEKLASLLRSGMWPAHRPTGG